MEDKLRNTFDSIEASEYLKRKTKAHIRKKTLDYGRDVMRLRLRRQRLAGCIASLVLLIGGLGFWNLPLTTIGMDVNPSVEIQVNGLDRVIALKGRNEDGRNLASEFDVAGMTYDEAVQRILVSDALAPYLDNGSTFVITVSGRDSDHTQQMLNRVVCRTYALAEDEQVFCVRADSATARAAGRVGLSVARYQAWQVLLAENPQLPPEATLELTVAQIQELIHGVTLDNPCGE